MALRHIECPHCQQNVELDVTSVTRSRDCPKCGKPIMLQFTSTQKRSKRTALMVPNLDPMDKLTETQRGAHEGSRAVEGDVYERMSHDPEVRKSMRRLVWGAGIVAALIALLSLAYYLNWWSALGGLVDKPAPTTVEAPPANSESSQTTPVPVPATAPATTDATTSAPSSTSPPAPTPSSAPLPPEPPSPPPPVAMATPLPSPTDPQPPPTPAPSIPSSTQSSTSAVIVTTAAGPIEEERAMKIAGAFLNAKNVDERLATIGDQERMEPIVRAYYTRHPDGPIAFSLLTPEAGMRKANSRRDFEVHLADGTKRRLSVGRTRGGEHRVDWSSFVVYSAMEWDEFLAKRPTDPVLMRVLAQTDSRYEGAFADDRKFFGVKLINPLKPESPPIHAYAPRQTAAAQTFNLAMRTTAGEAIPVIVMLKFPPAVEGAETSPNQVLIDQYKGDDWSTIGN